MVRQRLVIVLATLLTVLGTFYYFWTNPISAGPAPVAASDPDGKYLPVDFNLLAGYMYLGWIPNEVKALNGRQVSLIGFMVPLKGDYQHIEQFMIVRNHMLCCFGNTPQINEWAMVRPDSGVAVPYLPNVPVIVQGRFEVGEHYGGGQLESLYRVTAARVLGPDDPDFNNYVQAAYDNRLSSTTGR